MYISKFAQYLDILEQTSKRLEITEILKNMLKEMEKAETDKGIFLSLGYLRAQFNSLQFNIAEKMMVKILANAFNESEEKINKLYGEEGDLGNVAFKVNPNEKPSKTTILEVHKKLEELATISGTGSQEKKIQKASQILALEDKLTSKFLTRIILSTVRLGFTELTVIDALAKLIFENVTNAPKEKSSTKHNLSAKELKIKIEAKYRIRPDIGTIAKVIKENGLEGIDYISMEVGVPVHAQKAQRLADPQEIIEKLGSVWAEYKFDGTRVQLHLDRSRKMPGLETNQQDLFESRNTLPFVKTFTRNLEETTHQFPDLVEAANKQIDAQSVILDGEAIGYNKKTGDYLPFQETMQRKRKHGIKEAVVETPLKYLIFDILYLNGKTLVDLPLVERRIILDKIIKGNETLEIDYHMETKDVKRLIKFSKEALDRGLEGIMAKKPDSFYEAGARNFTWVKLKKSQEQILGDTIDCVVLGYYFGRGVRANFGIGGFLVGIWDKRDQKYKTITKVGTGLKDEEWEKLKEMVDKVKIKEKTKNADISSKYDCDVWANPEIVVEIAADEISKSSEHSAGFALRFPRLIKFREDKSATDTTTPEEFEQMYRLQKKPIVKIDESLVES
ncbi:ATP-dependent DNA ligase [candidate division WWE3 bacterium]|nr:ATP-dependent DNA ligase [candidate division WWE3 bacterium]